MADPTSPPPPPRSLADWFRGVVDVPRETPEEAARRRLRAGRGIGPTALRPLPPPTRMRRLLEFLTGFPADDLREVGPLEAGTTLAGLIPGGRQAGVAVRGVKQAAEAGMDAAMAVGRAANEAAEAARSIRAYHGSPKVYSELQPGSMLTTDPAWAAGYTTDPKWVGAGPDRFVGRVHAAEVPFGERTLQARSLHDAEGVLIDRARHILGRPARTLREAADAVATQGYSSIVARNAAGEVTGVIPLTGVQVAEHLDPHELVQRALQEGRFVASNLRAIVERGAR